LVATTRIVVIVETATSVHPSARSRAGEGDHTAMIIAVISPGAVATRIRHGRSPVLDAYANALPAPSTTDTAIQRLAHAAFRLPPPRTLRIAARTANVFETKSSAKGMATATAVSGRM